MVRMDAAMEDTEALVVDPEVNGAIKALTEQVVGILVEQGLIQMELQVAVAHSTLEKIKSQIAEDDSVEARNRDLEHTA